MKKKISTEDFDRILAEIMDDETGYSLLQVPGAYEVFSEHFNNEVLKRFENEADDNEND